MESRSEAATVAPEGIAATEARAIPWRLYGVAALTGPLIAVAFLDPRFYAVTWISWVPLFWALQRARSAREAGWCGFSAGFVTNFLGYYWLVYTMTVFGGFPSPLSLFFYVCLTAYSAGQFALLGLAFRRVGFAGLGAAPAIVWAALEFIYPNLFAWRMANSQFHLPVLLQVGDLTGPFPLSLALVWTSAGVLLLLERRRVAPLAAAATLVAAIAVYGAVRMPQIEAAMAAAPVLRVALVQGNISVEKKVDSSYFEVNVDTYRELTRRVQDDVDLVIWPETVAQWWTPADAESVQAKHHPLPDLRRMLVYGGPSFRYLDGLEEPETFNSAFLLGPESRIHGRYDKQILLPFGEYLPGSSLLPFIKDISPNTGDYTPGRTNNTFSVPGAVLGPLICYEDVVIGIPREMTRAGAQILFNILNDAWFGDSAGPYEHLQLALWRAVENRRYLLRASNSGVTSIVDPLGRIVAELPTFKEDVLIADVQPLSLLSFYTRWGDVCGWGLVVVAALLVVVVPGSKFQVPGRRP